MSENTNSPTESLFREPKAQVETPKQPESVYKTIETETINVSEGDDMPLNLYKEDGRAPYFLKLIEGGEFSYKTFNVKDLSELVDDYLLKQGTDKESYKKAFDDLVKRSKAEGDVYTTIDKLHEFVRIQNKLMEALREKEEFERKSPDEMSSKELKRYLRIN